MLNFYIGLLKVNVIDINDVENFWLIYYKVIGDFDLIDVEFCGDYVFVILDDN